MNKSGRHIGNLPSRSSSSSPKYDYSVMASQAFPNTHESLVMPSTRPNFKYVDLTTGRIRREVRTLLKRTLDSTLYDVAQRFDTEKDDLSIYRGSAGIAFANLRVAEVTNGRLHRLKYRFFDNKTDATRYLAAAALYLRGPSASKVSAVEAVAVKACALESDRENDRQRNTDAAFSLGEMEEETAESTPGIAEALCNKHQYDKNDKDDDQQTTKSNRLKSGSLASNFTSMSRNSDMLVNLSCLSLSDVDESSSSTSTCDIPKSVPNIYGSKQPSLLLSVLIGPPGRMLVKALLAYQEENPSLFTQTVHSYVNFYQIYLFEFQEQSSIPSTSNVSSKGNTDKVKKSTTDNTSKSLRHSGTDHVNPLTDGTEIPSAINSSSTSSTSNPNLSISKITDDWMYGRASYLMGCLILNNVVHQLGPPTSSGSPEDAAKAESMRESSAANGNPLPISRLIVDHLAASLINNGTIKAKIRGLDRLGCPLLYDWDGTIYIGAANGMFGILNVLLNVPGILSNSEFREKIKGTIDFLAGSCLANGNWPIVMGENTADAVQFCHGAAGAVFMFSKAAGLFPQSATTYRNIILHCGNLIWRFGLLKRSSGLCHGIAGAAYALLAIYKEFNDILWLERALTFAICIFDPGLKSESEIKSHSNSLFEGGAGIVCLLADLIRSPKDAAFPFVELEKWE